MNTRWTPETTPTLRILDDPDKKKLIVKMAKYYVRYKKVTYVDVATKFNIARSTLSNYFKNYLPKIDSALATKVFAKVEVNRAKLMNESTKNSLKKKS